MPIMVKIAVDPAFKPETADEKEQFALAKKLGTKEVEFTTAKEAVKNSRGMYVIVPGSETKDEVAPPPERALSDMTNQELLRIMVGMGVKTEKQMKRSQIIQVIEKKLAEVEIIPEDDAN